MLRVIILKKARVFVPRGAETANQHIKKKSANHFLHSKSNEEWIQCIDQTRMNIALEENLHGTYIYATIFPIIVCRISNKMCAFLIKVLLFTISSVYFHFSLLTSILGELKHKKWYEFFSIL
jgi:hypothetical protein